MIQTQVLNHILASKDSEMLIQNNLTVDFFSDYVDEFNFIKEHYSTYNVIPDTLTFLERFPNFDLADVDEPNSYLINELYKDRNKRKLINDFNKTKNLILSGDTESAIKFYLNSVEELSTVQHIDCVDILQDTSRYDAYVDRCDDFNKHYITTGFKELDSLVGGWDRHEELATIVARSNQGKSWVLLKCAAGAIKQGLRVGIYSGEMSINKVGGRLDTLLGNIPNRSITQGDSSIQVEYRHYIESLPSKYKGSCKVLTPSLIGGPAGVTALRAFIEREDLDVLYIDQHSLLEDDRNAKNPVERASNISKDLKNLQVLKQIPIISVSQQNRVSTETGIGLEHIAQADRIGQDSTIVIALEQKSTDVQKEMVFHLVKSRDTENNKSLTYSIDLNRGIFNFIPDQNTATPEQCQSLKDKYDDTGESPF